MASDIKYEEGHGLGVNKEKSEKKGVSLLTPMFQKQKFESPQHVVSYYNTGIGNVHEIRNGNELYHKGHQRTVGIIEQDK